MYVRSVVYKKKKISIIKNIENLKNKSDEKSIVKSSILLIERFSAIPIHWDYIVSRRRCDDDISNRKSRFDVLRKRIRRKDSYSKGKDRGRNKTVNIELRWNCHRFPDDGTGRLLGERRSMSAGGTIWNSKHERAVL